MSFKPPIGDASTTKKGLIQLSGDLGGTAAVPVVPGLAAKADASALDDYVATSRIGVANGVASLDSGGKIPSAQLQLTFPVTTVAGRAGDVTLAKADVGLENVDNTSDADKPVSTATQTALNGKAAAVHVHAIAEVTNLQASLDAKADTTALSTGLAGKANVSHVHAVGDVTGLQTALDGKAAATHTHTVAQISDSTTVGRAVLTAADAAAAQSALAIANMVQVVDSFDEVTTPVYGTLYVVRA